MPHWYWEKKELRQTPSQVGNVPDVSVALASSNGQLGSNVVMKLDYDCEMRYRREGARFIIELGKALNLSHSTMASGAVYFHRFYMFHSFTDFPKYVVATCCLFLAGKAEETPKKCKDLIRTVRQLTNDRQFATFGVDPKEEVMVTERVLLQTIKFDLQVDHPYASLIKYAKCLKGDKAKLQKMVQMSWTFVNDSLCTTLCLQWEPEIIAIALMYLAAKLSKFEVRDWNDRKDWHKHWWDQYVEDLDVDILEDICHQVLDLYTQPHTPAREQAESPPPGSRQPQPTPATKTPTGKKNTTPPPPRESSVPPPPPHGSRSRPHTPPMPPPIPQGSGTIGAPPQSAPTPLSSHSQAYPPTFVPTAPYVRPPAPLPPPGPPPRHVHPGYGYPAPPPGSAPPPIPPPSGGQFYSQPPPPPPQTRGRY